MVSRSEDRPRLLRYETQQAQSEAIHSHVEQLQSGSAGHERHRVDRSVVDLNLEMQVQSGAGASGSFDP